VLPESSGVRVGDTPARSCPLLSMGMCCLRIRRSEDRILRVTVVPIPLSYEIKGAPGAPLLGTTTDRREPIPTQTDELATRRRAVHPPLAGRRRLVWTVVVRLALSATVRPGSD
jgi:hypothetical protein